MTTNSYPQLPGLVIADAQGDARSLNQQVWTHEKAARAQGLPLVIEIFARSVLASRRLTEWWQSGDQLMQDTLGGVYLLRIDLQRFGPEAILKLTPYAVTGAPLFVGWNAMGQVCSRAQFQQLTREAFALPLSAFVEDVLRGRQHSLNPVPNLGNAERTREALALRRAGQALLSAKRFEPTRHGAESPTAEPPREPAASEPAVATSEPVTETIAVSGLDLDLLLDRARAKFALLEDRVGASLELTLADLRTIDGYLATCDDEERAIFARELGAVLAVYVGDTIRQRVASDWALSAASGVSASALELRGNVLGEDKSVQPMEWVIEILGDSTRSLYGQVLSWARIY